MQSNISDMFKSKKIFLLDGAIGSLIQQNVEHTDKHLWTSIYSSLQPEIVTNVHKKYIQAGSDIITTNTFRSNPVALLNSDSDFSIDDLVKASIKCANDAIGGEKAKILAGSNAPAEDCYQIERSVAKQVLEYNHKKHIELLYENGCDFILNETQSHFDEIEIICKYCASNDIPFGISLFVDKNLNLLSGEPVFEIVEFCKNFTPLFISFNCVDFDTFGKLYGNISLIYDWGFYLNCGSGNYSDENISCGISPEDYLKNSKNYFNEKLKIIGSCCGSNYNHIKKLREHIDKLY